MSVSFKEIVKMFDHIFIPTQLGYPREYLALCSLVTRNKCVMTEIQFIGTCFCLYGHNMFLSIYLEDYVEHETQYKFKEGTDNFSCIVIDLFILVFFSL